MRGRGEKKASSSGGGYHFYSTRPAHCRARVWSQEGAVTGCIKVGAPEARRGARGLGVGAPGGHGRGGLEEPKRAMSGAASRPDLAALQVAPASQAPGG